MGDEIAQRHFNAEDYTRFRRRLDEETNAVRALFEDGGFSQRGDIAGFELEAWLVDAKGNPAAQNERFLAALDNPLVVPELASFNVELNGSPCAVTGRVFSRLHDELATTWEACRTRAASMGLRLAAIGILPTIKPDLLNSAYMSPRVRFQALNDRVLALRDGAPFELNLSGTDTLNMAHDDVMLEAAATSFQIHLQCRPDAAVRAYNGAIAASAPMVALAANSPFLFGKSLWAETRIPLFEQAVSVGPRNAPRVGFGDRYADASLFEVFRENQERHAILLPYVQDEPPSKFSHVRFQNGTVWRWNRPLLGFDFDGTPHLRIEHRVVPAGPTIDDCVANTAAFMGLARSFINAERPIEEELPFEAAKANFYAAARDGLDAELIWRHGRRRPARALLLDELLPAATDALRRFGLPAAEVERHVGLATRRVERNQNGATWQRTWLAKHGADFNALTLAYLDAQDSGRPVHEWTI